MNEFSTVLQQVLIIFLIMAVGIFLSKKGMLDKNGSKQITNIAINVVSPSLIFMSFQLEYDAQRLISLLFALAMSATVFIVSILLSNLLIRKKEGCDSGVERFAVVYSNCGYMGIPLISAIFGQEGVFYTSAVIAVFNALVWSHGVMTMQDKLSLRELLNVLKSPNIIAVVLGLLCYVFRITIPYIPAQTMQYLADMNTPLAMLISGATVASANIKQTFASKRIWLLSFYKLLLIPLVAALVLKLFNAPETVYRVVAITTACPTAGATTLIALKCGKNAEYGSQILAATTILSIITLPIFTMLI
ncbi:MAG: AEC family transporter [Clostridia bacterium]|nr:AEC family transporter [Clostridia bacterium]